MFYVLGRMIICEAHAYRGQQDCRVFSTCEPFLPVNETLLHFTPCRFLTHLSETIQLLKSMA